MLVDTALSLVKAFRLKGDVDSLVTEHFSSKEVENAKASLWDHCKLDLEAKGDSDGRSQLAANLDDLVQIFDALDSTARIPPIYHFRW